MLLGQLISFLYFAGSAITSTIQTLFRISPPSFFAFLVYGSLSLFLIPVYLARRSHLPPKAKPTRSTPPSLTPLLQCLGSLLLRAKLKRNKSHPVHSNNERSSSPELDEHETADDYNDSIKPLQHDHDIHNNDHVPHYPHYFLNCIPIRGSLPTYLIIGWIDYMGTVCTIVALKYTPLTSYTILWSLVTPAAMLFSKCLLVRQYRMRHLIGVGLCIAGAILNVLQDGADDHHNHTMEDSNSNNIDIENDEEERYPYKVFGDAIAALGAALFGLLDILCEYSLEHFDGGTSEYLGVTAFIAATLSLGAALLFEQEEISLLLESLRDNEHGFHLLLLLVVVDVGSYYYSCRFLEISESALLNLSTLTESLMAVAFSVLVEEIVPAPLFFVGLTWTILGLVIYETSPSPIVDSYLLVDQHSLELPTTMILDSASTSKRKNKSSIHKDGDTSTHSTVHMANSPSDEELDISSHTSNSSNEDDDVDEGDDEHDAVAAKVTSTPPSRWLPQFISAQKGVPLRRQRSSVATATTIVTTKTAQQTPPLLQQLEQSTLQYKKY